MRVSNQVDFKDRAWWREAPWNVVQYNNRRKAVVNENVKALLDVVVVHCDCSIWVTGCNVSHRIGFVVLGPASEKSNLIKWGCELTDQHSKLKKAVTIEIEVDNGYVSSLSQLHLGNE